MAKLIVILLTALVFEAVGVVLLSAGLKSVVKPEKITVGAVVGLVKQGITNGKVLLGVLLEALFFGILLYLLSRHDVSLIWPLTSLGMVITSLAAKYYLREEVSGLRWSGVCLIVAGSALITWSERLKTQPPAAPPLAESRVSPE